MTASLDHIQWTYTLRSFGNLYDLGFMPITFVRERAIRQLGLAPGMRVLDVGCGTGLNLPYLARAVGPEGEVVGVDYTRAMLEKAKQRCERQGLGQVRLIEADAATVTLPEGSFDAVLCTHVLSIIPRSREALQRALGALKPGGRVVVMDLQRLGAPVPGLTPFYEQVVNPLYEQLAYTMACAHPDREILAELRRMLVDVEAEAHLGGAVFIASGTKA